MAPIQRGRKGGGRGGRYVALHGPQIPRAAKDPVLRAKLLLILFRPWFSVDDLLRDEAFGQVHDGFVSAWAAYETALTDRAARFARDPDGHGLFSSEWFAWHALAVIRNLDYSASGHEVAEALRISRIGRARISE